MDMYILFPCVHDRHDFTIPATKLSESINLKEILNFKKQLVHMVPGENGRKFQRHFKIRTIHSSVCVSLSTHFQRGLFV